MKRFCKPSVLKKCHEKERENMIKNILKLHIIVLSGDNSEEKTAILQFFFCTNLPFLVCIGAINEVINISQKNSLMNKIKVFTASSCLPTGTKKTLNLSRISRWLVAHKLQKNVTNIGADIGCQCSLVVIVIAVSVVS